VAVARLLDGDISYDSLDRRGPILAEEGGKILSYDGVLVSEARAARNFGGGPRFSFVLIHSNTESMVARTAQIRSAFTTMVPIGKKDPDARLVLAAISPQRLLQFQAKLSLTVDCLSQVGRIASESSGKLGDADLLRFRLREPAKAGGCGEVARSFGV
jgi:hypothetical protein